MIQELGQRCPEAKGTGLHFRFDIGVGTGYKDEVTHFRETLRLELARARAQTDRLFRMLASSALYDRPIPERHRIVFYLGHFEAFDWNMVAVKSFGLPSFNPEFDRIFEFGIDPVDGQLPQDKPCDWPASEEILSYNRRVRETVDALLNGALLNGALLDGARLTDSPEPPVDNGNIFRMVIEHRLMHAETLAYMLHWLPGEQKDAGALLPVKDVPAPESRPIRIPAGVARLGRSRDGSASFGWDNEFESNTAVVPEFSIDSLNITNGQFLEFMDRGGYEDPSLWSSEGRQWIQASGIRHPKFWIRRGERWLYRTMFEEIPLPASWPVYVSQAEAEAYARWAHKSLPTEQQFHRAAFGTPGDGERSHPWGNAEPSAQHGNFDFQSWTPVPVGSFPAGRSAFGVWDLVGNGWEWTNTPFAPFAGFRPLPLYPGYSADFFDGKHFVLKGASPRTSASLVRPSFRNWFQPYYPNIYATFRCAEN